MKIVVIGGGAAGFFSAMAAKEAKPDHEVLLFEKSNKFLSKVKISGGGRCNVTHACFDPRELIKNYPRGNKELLGPFHRFQPQDTVNWFTQRGVSLKEEADGRMFPTTDSSQTVIDCLIKVANQLGVILHTQVKVKKLEKTAKDFLLHISNDETIKADRVILASGSTSAGFDFAKSVGHTIQQPVPSLFTFNVPSFSLMPLAGVSVQKVKLSIQKSSFAQEGPLLITHWGFSGPCALKLSAFAARYLAEKNYEVSLSIDWLPSYTEQNLHDHLRKLKSKKTHTIRFAELPNRIIKTLIEQLGIPPDVPLNQIGKTAIVALINRLKFDRYDVKGKTTHKEEFVTCGGITLSEVNFKTMESKLCKGLYFCGEILDIDGVTGGFNFQNAWTTGWIAGLSSSMPG